MAKSKKKSSEKEGIMNRSSAFFKNAYKWLWLLLIAGLLFTAAVFILISKSKMPDTEELENPKYEEASLVFSNDNTEIGRYYSENRDLLSYEELNPFIVKALVATEDERFFDHSGVDARGTMRAIAFLGKKGGASTITQQLAKLFFTQKSNAFVKRVWQKLQEWVIAIQFEKRYTKEEIISMYLNKFEYKYNSFGIGAAANTYFGKDQKNLSLEEAALLVGILKGPTYYDPKRYPDRAMKRRNIVLYQMVRNNFLSQNNFELLKEKPIDLSGFKKPVHYDGLAPYFRTTLTKELKSILAQDKYAKPDGTTYNIYEDGLNVYTTIDLEMQRHAEQAAFDHMKKVQANYEKAWSGIDPWNYTKEKDPKKKKDQLEFRNNFLLRERRASDRYVSMRNSILGKVIDEATTKYPKCAFDHRDFIRLIKEEKEPGYINNLVRQGWTSQNKAKVYKEILKDPIWSRLKLKRNELIQKANDVFSKPVKMKVFDYSTSGEKTVTMSPMDSIKYHQEHMQLGSVAIDPKTGYVKAWVGGINNKYFKLDHVKTNRQAGSTFKPFLYATVMEHQALSPCTKVQDIRHGIPANDSDFGLLKPWYPKNSDNKYTSQYYTLKDALLYSKNSISAWLIKELGSAELLKNHVVKLGVDESKIKPYPSIVLGTPEITVLEMTAAYATYANYGLFNEPTFIERIEDKNGKLIYSPRADQKRVMNEKYSYAVINFLQHAASKVKGQLKSDFGGKTGTTNDFVDGWFVGISPELVVGTWVGGENSWIRFRNNFGYGSQMARPFYVSFMSKLENDPNIKLNLGKSFEVPEGDIINFDCEAFDTIPSKVEIQKAKKIKVLKDEEFDDEFGEG